MQKLSRLALAAALSVGALSTIATPAMAQKQEKKASAQLSKEFRAAAQPAQEAIVKAQTFSENAKKLKAAGNAAGAATEEANAKAAYAAAKPLVDAMGPLAKSPDELNYYGQFRLQVAVNTDDAAGQRAALDTLIAANKDDQAQMAKYHFFAGNFAYQAKDYAKAITLLERAKQLGSNQPELDALMIDSYLASNQTAKGLEMAKAAIAARKASGQPMSEDLFTRPAMALQAAGRKAEVAQLLIDRVEYFPKAAYYDNAANMLLTQNLPEDAKLALYRLKAAGGFMSEPVDYAALAFAAGQSGLSQEALDAIRDGRAKGKITAAVAGEVAALETQQKQRLASDSRTAVQSSENSARSAPTGRVARATGDGWMNYGEYDKAVAMYDLAVQKGGVDINGVTMAKGIALAKKGDKAGAQAAFAKVTGAYAPVARLWTTYLQKGVAG